MKRQSRIIYDFEIVNHSDGGATGLRNLLESEEISHNKATPVQQQETSNEEKEASGDSEPESE